MIKRNKRKIIYALCTLFLFILFVLFVVFVSPHSVYSVGFFSISSLPFFFVLLFLTMYLGVITFLPSGFHGLLIAGFVTTYFLFRLNGLTNPLFFVLLLALLLLLELVIYKR